MTAKSWVMITSANNVFLVKKKNAPLHCMKVRRFSNFAKNVSIIFLIYICFAKKFILIHNRFVLSPHNWNLLLQQCNIHHAYSNVQTMHLPYFTH